VIIIIHIIMIGAFLILALAHCLLTEKIVEVEVITELLYCVEDVLKKKLHPSICW